MDWLGQQLSSVKNAVVGEKKLPFPGGEPDSEQAWAYQAERIKKEEEANKPGVLSSISAKFNSFLGKEGGRRLRKTKRNKNRKQTKNKRR